MSLPSVTVFDGSIDSGGDTINAGNSFSNDQALTYTAPTPDVVFGTAAANQDYVCGFGFVNDNNDELFVGFSDGHGGITDPGYSTGDAVYYLGSGIGGLSSGTTYYVINLGGHEIWLDTDQGDATGGGPYSDVVSLSPDKSNTALSSLVRDNNAPIAGLNSGQTYYAENTSGSSFQLAGSPGGSIIDIDTGGRSGGPQKFAVEGIDFTSGGGGKLVLDITGTSSGTQQFLGIGGNVPTGAPVGDGIVTGTASGGGGGAIQVGDANATSSSHVTVSTTVQGNTTISGANVNITTHGHVNTAGSVVINGGGLVAVDNAATGSAAFITNTLTVNSGATINASNNVDVNAYSQVGANVAAASNSGGFIGSATGNDEADLDYVNKTLFDGTITAGNTATVEAHADVNGVANASGDTGGFIAGGGARAHANVGDHGGAVNQVDIQGNANIVSANLEPDGAGRLAEGVRQGQRAHRLGLRRLDRRG